MAGFLRSTSYDRLQAHKKLLRLSTDTMSAREEAVHIYHVAMLELHVWRINRIEHKAKKHASWLSNNLELIKLRRELTHL